MGSSSRSALAAGGVAGRLLVLFLLLFAPSGQADIAVEDARGTTVRLTAPAERIVALAPFLTELVYAAGAGGRLIAVSAHSDFPPAARELPVVGDSARLDMERLLALKPDLVLAWGSGNATGEIAVLERLGLRVFVAEPARLDHIPALLRRLGTLAGTQAQAEAAAAAFSEKLATLKPPVPAPPVRVFLQIAAQPLMTLNGRHLVSAVLAYCGGENVFAAAPLLAPRIDWESVIAADPEVILRTDAGGEALPPIAARLRAVRAGRVFALEPDLILRPTPRILSGVEQVCGHLETARGASGQAGR